MVGDPHQQIYAFRGAINAMELVQATQTFYLTQVCISLLVPHFFNCFSQFYGDSHFLFWLNQFAVRAYIAACVIIVLLCLVFQIWSRNLCNCCILSGIFEK